MIFLVPNRTTATLMEIIDQFVEPQSILHSDEFRSYVNHDRTSRITQFLPNKNFEHYWVNHSVSFVNPLWPNIHTNNIERIWSHMRKKVKRNFPLENIQDWLNTFLFEKNIAKEYRYTLLMTALANTSSLHL